MALLDSIVSLTLDLPPSCIAICPRQPQLFVVGTYHLHRKEQEGDLSAENQQSTTTEPLPDDTNTPNETPSEDDTAAPSTSRKEAPQKRTGSLILFHLNDDNTITHLSTTSTDFAILDIQWSPHPEKLDGDVLAVATSTGLLAFYRLDACGSSLEGQGSSEGHVKETTASASASSHELKLACEKTIADPSTLILSLTWHASLPNTLGVTLSDGRVCVVESPSAIWNEDADVRVTDIHAHTLEAWTLVFNPYQQQQILSGGDDIALQCSHIETQDSHPQLLWQDRKLHDAGITAILPLSEKLVVTGSYDDHIRLLSVPRVGRRKCLAELNLGGGVWRLKALPSDTTAEDSSSPPTRSTQQHILLASCMHAGTRIVKLTRGEGDEDEGAWEFEVLARFEEHRSMNYGSDVQPEGGGDGKGKGKKRIVSTSFYDRLLCLWEWS